MAWMQEKERVVAHWHEYPHKASCESELEILAAGNSCVVT
jgi:hypothetical protein